jgi:hypothetical protein
VTGKKLPNCEKIALGVPMVIIERLTTARVERIRDSVKRGYKVVIPRLPGLNYVKVVPKVEMPDLFPGATREELEEMKKELEEEQEESKRLAEERQKMKSQKLPPLRISRERILEETDIEQNALELYQKLTKCCECKKTFPDIEQAMNCLKAHGYKRCWICLKLLSVQTPMEQHYRTSHYDSSIPGEVSCPICKMPVKYWQWESI